MIPYKSDRMDEDVKDLLQDFSLDPQRVAKASASKLGACSFCGSRLSDPISKKMGYGPVCASNYHLPWGDKTNAVVELPTDLRDFFK